MLRPAALLLLALAALVTSAGAQAAEPPEGFAPLFDGETLTGWEGKDGVFRIEEGAIVAGTLKERIPNNEFLCTEKEYGDFELRLQVKVLGEKPNAGIQFRSQRVPNHHEVSGYQADVGDGWWGKLYDESRRNRVLAGDKVDLGDKFQPRDWNDYVIRCEGPRIQLWVNGVQTVDYTETEAAIPLTGRFGLQVHGGPPTEAWYRNLHVQELPAKER